MMTPTQLDETTYALIVNYDIQHGSSIEPHDLLTLLAERDPTVPELVWRQSAIRMYRKRSAEQRRHADELERYARSRRMRVV